jgi:hypothetical protein
MQDESQVRSLLALLVHKTNAELQVLAGADAGESQAAGTKFTCFTGT